MSSKTEQSLLPGFVEESPLTTNEETNEWRKPQLKYRPDGVCEGPGCGKPVPGGMVHINVDKYFCSKSCQRKEYLSRNVIGECENCRGPITGVNRRRSVVRFCSRDCDNNFTREALLSSAGCFRPIIEEYLAVAKYKDLSAVRASLCGFFRHVVTVEKLNSLEQITPRAVTRFLAAEKARGMTSSNAVSRLSTFFNWLTDEERFDKRNPIIPRIHSSNENPRTRQPYEDGQMAFLWRIVEATDNTQLKAMFAIGEESGLRNSEVCNIRLEDIDMVKQTIYVRLPTKNGEPRTVPFHNKVKKYVQQWLKERDPRCKHDHLFHTERLTPAKWCLDEWFRNLFGNKPEPAASFEFHRLRHTWATRLVNAGMELPVLQQLGGWKSLRSVQIYAKIRKSTVDRQYEAAYAVIEQKLESPEEEILSLLDFALMSDDAPATTADSAT